MSQHKFDARGLPSRIFRSIKTDYMHNMHSRKLLPLYWFRYAPVPSRHLLIIDR